MGLTTFSNSKSRKQSTTTRATNHVLKRVKRTEDEDDLDKRYNDSPATIVPWMVLPKLVVYLILQNLIRISSPDYIRVISRTCLQWQRYFRDAFLWKPIFEEIAKSRQSFMPPGIDYLIRPPSLSHLDFISLWETKHPIPSIDCYCGLGAKIDHGSVYEGGFSANRAQGAAVLYQTGGSRSPSFRYVGKFQMDHFTGNCEYLLANKDRFTGTCKFVNQQYLCNGTWEYHDGSIYTGEVLENARHGTGALVTTEGTFESAYWRNDKLCGFTKVTRPDGTIEYQFN